MTYYKISEEALRCLLTNSYEHFALRDYIGIDKKVQESANAKFTSDCIVIDEQYYDSLKDVVEADLKQYEIIKKE